MNNTLTDRTIGHNTQPAWLLRLSRLGTLLSLAILSASAVLRLQTVLDAQGHAVSMLDPDIEYLVRLLHRLSATTVGLIAVTVLILSWRKRRTGLKVWTPALCIACSVLLLILIGPWTSGYLYGGITVLNVLGGMCMLTGFWWLSETIALSNQTQQAGLSAVALKPALLRLMLHVASGAATSAWFMYGIHWPVLVHLLTLVPLLALIGKKAGKPGTPVVVTTYAFAAGLAGGLQLLSGSVLLWQSQRTFGLSMLHAVSAYLLMLFLVSAWLRSSRVPAYDNN